MAPAAAAPPPPSTSRSDRQLMRQRGAGRNFENVDFGIKVGTGSGGRGNDTNNRRGGQAREERQLMRQRGAGNRKIDNVDFGFSFPTPTPGSNRRQVRDGSRSRRSSTRTPRSVARSVRQSSVSIPAQDDGSRPTATSSEQRMITPTPRSFRSVVRQSSSKRRKLDLGLDLNSNHSINGIQNSVQRLRNASGTVFEIAEEPEEVQQRRMSRVTSLALSAPESPLFFPDGEIGAADKENENEAALNKLDFLHINTDASPEQNALRRSTRSSLHLQNQSSDALAEAGATTVDQASSEPTEQLEASRLTEIQTIEDESLHFDDLSSEFSVLQTSTAQQPSKKKRKKRKSVVLGRKKRRSSGNNSKLSNPSNEDTLDESTADLETTRDLEESREGDVDESRLENEEEETVASVESVQHTAKTDKLFDRFKHRRNEGTGSPTPASPVFRRDSDVDGDADEDEDETYVDEVHTPEPPTPAPKRKPAGKKRARTSNSSNEGQPARKNRKAGMSFPILTHRMTNLEALPTIFEQDEEGQRSDPDDEHSRPFFSGAFTGRSAPNAVDVLAQICRETIDGAIEKLCSSSAATASRAEIKRKRTALEAFSHNLDAQLFDMSEAVENRLNLEARLRKARRQKAELQARWMQIRRERDTLALQADVIRRENWENEEKARAQWEISELAQRTELALQHERERPDLNRDSMHDDSSHSDIEFLLRSLAEHVSCSGGKGGGMLGQIKTFNKRLEVMAIALEGRSS